MTAATLRDKREHEAARDFFIRAARAYRSGDGAEALAVCRLAADLDDRYSVEARLLPLAFREGHAGGRMRAKKAHECAVCGRTVEPDSIVRYAIYHDRCHYRRRRAGLTE